MLFSMCNLCIVCTACSYCANDTFIHSGAHNEGRGRKRETSMQAIWFGILFHARRVTIPNPIICMGASRSYPLPPFYPSTWMLFSVCNLCIVCASSTCMLYSVLLLVQLLFYPVMIPLCLVCSCVYGVTPWHVLFIDVCTMLNWDIRVQAYIVEEVTDDFSMCVYVY